MGGRECVRPRSNSSAVGCIRVSTEEQTLGPEAQRVALQRWADTRRLSLVAVHEDRGVSGAAPLDRRPGLLAALASLETRAAAYLVAAQLVSADAGEGDSPEAALMWRLVDAIASYERDLIRGRTRAALAIKRAKGLKFGSTAPYGSRIDGDRLIPTLSRSCWRSASWASCAATRTSTTTTRSAMTRCWRRRSARPIRPASSASGSATGVTR